MWKIRTILVFLAGFSLFSFTVTNAQKVDEEQIPETIEELKIAILDILRETSIPGAGIALVNKNGPYWVEGLGKANVEQNIAADEETMFRIGSTSKVFVALAILSLQEQEKLNLEDEVRHVIPEIEFTNPWEDSNPITIEHLLEHTTGWDDLHLIEHDQKGTEIVSLKEALQFHPHSRVSRWVPAPGWPTVIRAQTLLLILWRKSQANHMNNILRKAFLIPWEWKT